MPVQSLYVDTCRLVSYMNERHSHTFRQLLLSGVLEVTHPDGAGAGAVAGGGSRCPKSTAPPTKAPTSPIGAKSSVLLQKPSAHRVSTTASDTLQVILDPHVPVHKRFSSSIRIIYKYAFALEKGIFYI